MDIAIIGAGMAGLTCGMHLRTAGHTVRIYDKGRGPGGRMATRRAEAAGETLRFDHGAQYFTVKDPRFCEQVDAWEEQGVAARWPAAGDDAWVGTPGMNAPIKTMADKLDAEFGIRVDGIRREGDAYWLVADGDTLGTSVDAVVVAVPAEQAGPLVVDHVPRFAEMASATKSDPCWTVMAGFAEPLDHEDTIRDAGPIGWAARNSAKPDRIGGECWVVQACPEWSREHLEDEKEKVVTALLDTLRKQLGGKMPVPVHTDAHRWRYSRSGSAGEGALWDEEHRIGLCGDWLIGPRVESAYVSGRELAEKIGPGD